MMSLPTEFVLNQIRGYLQMYGKLKTVTNKCMDGQMDKHKNRQGHSMSPSNSADGDKHVIKENSENGKNHPFFLILWVTFTFDPWPLEN